MDSFLIWFHSFPIIITILISHFLDFPYFWFVFMYLDLCVFDVCVGGYRGLKRALDALELELQVSVSFLMTWVLGTDLGPSAGQWTLSEVLSDASSFLDFLLRFVYFVYECFTCMHICTCACMFVSGDSRGQKRASDP